MSIINTCNIFLSSFLIFIRRGLNGYLDLGKRLSSWSHYKKYPDYAKLIHPLLPQMFNDIDLKMVKDTYDTACPMFSFFEVDPRMKKAKGNIFRSWWESNNSDTNKRIIVEILGYDLDSMLNLGIERKPCHDLLGVSSTATKTEINQAYRKLALMHHPDKGGSLQAMQELNKARQQALIT